MQHKLVATSSTTINASPKRTWDALVTPDAIKQYMFGTTVVSDWKEGAAILWKGEWQGRRYEDKGVILRFDPERQLRFTHFSPLSGLPEKPENYHTVTIDLAPDGARTHVSLAQDNNRTEEERQHSEMNWHTVLAGLKNYVEQ